MYQLLKDNIEVKIVDNIIKSINTSKNGIKIIKDDKVFDFHNSFILSGISDSHGHIYGLGQKLNGLSLDGMRSKEQCIAKAKNFTDRRGQWLCGRGWNQELWSDSDMPTKDDLDQIFPDFPVYLIRIDGHAAWLNSKALEIAGIDKDTSNPIGGLIQKDEYGVPTGILIDTAMDLAQNLIPDYKKEQKKKFVLDATRELAKNGITEVHDMDVAINLLPIFTELEAEDELPLRVFSFIRGFDSEWENSAISRTIGNRHSVVGLKFYADGALGSRGAAMLSPYYDDDSTQGLFLTDEDFLIEYAEKGIKNGFQIATHAIGDAANRMVISAYMAIRKNFADSVLRVEHSQIVHPTDQIKMAMIGAIPSVQPIHCISDKKMAEKRLDPRTITWAYPWKSLLNKGCHLIAGSDFPIESHNPFEGIDAFIKRRAVGEISPWFVDQALTPNEAFSAYIHNPKVSILPSLKRGLEVGAEADFTIIDKDYSIPESLDFKNSKVLATFCQGKISYLDEN